MKLTDLFKSKSPKGKPDPRIRWFGKLPTYGDYYTSGSEEGWTREFHDWLMRGYDLYLSRRTGHPKTHRHLPISGFALRLPNSQMTVLGTLQDYGGDMRGRPFPMCFYVGIPTRQWPGPTASLLRPGAQAIRDLMALRDDMVRFFNAPGHFDSYMQGREIDIAEIAPDNPDDRWRNPARELAFQDWFEGLDDSPHRPSPAAWLELLDTWGGHIESLESSRFQPTLCFPLAAGTPHEHQIAGWLFWLGLRMDLARRYASLIITGEPMTEPARVSLVARDLIPDDFLLMTPLMGTLAYVDNVTRLGYGSSPPDSTPDAGAAPTVPTHDPSPESSADTTDSTPAELSNDQDTDPQPPTGEPPISSAGVATEGTTAMPQDRAESAHPTALPTTWADFVEGGYG